MNTCWLHRRAIQNFLEGESPLPTGTQQHLDECETCAREMKDQRALIASLASKPASAEAPFLRSRIANAIRREKQESPPPRYAVALALIAICICAATLLLNRPRETNIVLEIEKPRLALSGKFESPYDKELENLRADTTNALRALAANFVPSRPE